jgi:hypothetical protein
MLKGVDHYTIPFDAKAKVEFGGRGSNAMANAKKEKTKKRKNLS